MLPRIGIALLALLGFSGFSAPKLPEESLAIYRFDRAQRVHDNSAVTTARALESSASFRLLVGYGRLERGLMNNRQMARQMLARLSSALEAADTIGAEISVARVYAPTRELVLEVAVSDGSTKDEVKTRLVAALGQSEGVSFVGEPARIRVPLGE